MRVTALALAVVASVVPVGLAVPPAAADNPLCESVRAEAAPDRVTFDAGPLAQLDVRAAQRLVAHDAPRGPSVRVAVLDSGVAGSHVPVAARYTVTGHQAVGFWHGTAVAGLVAGEPRPDGTEVGVAPDAQVVDVHVYDSDDPRDGATPTPDRLAAGLLGAHEVRGAHERARVGGRSAVRAAVRDAEVGHQRAAGARFEQDVVGLDVAVNEPDLVCRTERVQSVAGDVEHAGGSERPVYIELALDRAPVEVLERHVVIAVRSDAEVEHLHRVR